jgi:hypothetical protein
MQHAPYARYPFQCAGNLRTDKHAYEHTTVHACILLAIASLVIDHQSLASYPLSAVVHCVQLIDPQMLLMPSPPIRKRHDDQRHDERC